MVHEKHNDELADRGNVYRERRRLLDLTQQELSEKAKVHATQISRIERGARDVQPATLKRVADALGGIDVQKELPTTQELIAMKCLADFGQSVISDEAALKNAVAYYQSRIDRTAVHVRDVKEFRQLRGYEWALQHLYWLGRRGQLRTYNLSKREDLVELIGNRIPQPIRNAARTLREFVQNEKRPLRVSCAIMVGPIATICALREDHRLGLAATDIELTIEDASGVELMDRVVTRVAPFDFLFVATGAFNLTLVAHSQPVDYRPALPIHYEEQVNLCRPANRRRRDVTPGKVHIYEGSSGLEEMFVRAEELPRSLKLVRHPNFQTLPERLPFIDEGEMVNVWAPISTPLISQFGWVRPAISKYNSLICMYEHKHFRTKSLEQVARAFMALFVYQWNLLREGPSAALRYVINNPDLIRMFEIGAGIHAVRASKLKA